MRRSGLYVTISGTSTDIPGCWFFNDVLVLREMMSQRTPSPVHMPGADGGIMFPRYDGVTEKILRGEVYGDVDYQGTAHSDRCDGVIDNLEQMKSLWAGPVGSDDLREIKIHYVGKVSTGYAQVLDIAEDHSRMPSVAYVALRLRIPLAFGGYA